MEILKRTYSKVLETTTAPFSKTKTYMILD
jgi:hypothetical protein